MSFKILYIPKAKYIESVYANDTSYPNVSNSKEELQELSVRP